MTYPYFPPDEGYRRAPYKSWEILWLLSQGVSDTSTIRQKVGCTSRYVSLVKQRYARYSPESVLNKLEKVNRLWHTQTTSLRKPQPQQTALH